MMAHWRTFLARHPALVMAGLQTGAFALAWAGNTVFANRQWGRHAEALWQGGVLVLLGMVLWWVADQLRERCWTETPAGQPDDSPPCRARWSALHPARIFSILIGFNLSGAALVFNSRNTFTLGGVLAWLASIVVWWLALNGGLPRFPSIAIRSLKQQQLLIAVTLALILAAGAAFRLADLDAMPPEMTRDQAANLLDAYAIQNGYHPVFFPRNTGREPAQLYATALAASVPGLGLTFRTVKVVSAVEGLLTVLAVWALARTLLADRPRFGQVVGLAAAALLAVSYWHTAQSRMGLRLILAPLVTALLLVYLTRALRQNRREDFLAAGLVLGFGLYTYISVRLLPLVVLAGLVIAWRWGQRGERWRYALNTGRLFGMALVVFVPLLGYMLYQPDLFWSRIGGRLQGETFASVVDGDGNVLYEGDAARPAATLDQNAAVFAQNVANALMMYNWRGDEAWVSGIPYHPALDPFTGSLFILGVVTWGARLVRRRAPADLLLTAAFLIMLLPSALSLAYPNENPSATRMNGTLPAVYLVAAVALVQLCGGVCRLLPGRRGWVAGGMLAAVVIGGAAATNADLYFTRYRFWYTDSSFPYRQLASVVRQFNQPGNTFLVGYPMWVDENILAVEAGMIDWMNYATLVDLIPATMVVAAERDTGYRFDPQRDTLFLLSPQDTRAMSKLRQWFPHGQAETVPSTQNGMQFVLYYVPPLGRAGFNAFIQRQVESTR
ncbi:MAG: glycosyltransferase family 39 protein [Chloroflexi bacterium]|nr:glycosyltransferase family 39 protein [Chloroflexota bacterium]